MSARLALALPASLTEIRAWADRAERLGCDPHAAVASVVKGRLAAPVNVRRSLIAAVPAAERPQPLKRAKRARA